MRSRFSGADIVPEVVRLCAMNLYLHDIAGRESLVEVHDSLLGAGGRTFDVILTNPPFGKKQSYRIVRDDGEIETEREDYDRQDFFVRTSNKQLNFLQHIMTILAEGGEAATVMPDNVLFEGGAGETIRRKLLHECDVHTLLRLPTGMFYANGVKVNVLFFDRKPASPDPWTKTLWVYDLRTNKHFTLKANPLKRSDLDEFVTCFNADNRHDRKETWSESNPTGRWRAYPYESLLQRDKVSLEITWIPDESLEDSSSLSDPDEIAAEIVEDLRAALTEFELIHEDLAEA
jgi:type I restriction enzyme M protein